MRSGDLAPFGGDGGVVEVDETFIGRREGQPKAQGRPPEDEGAGAGGSRRRPPAPSSLTTCTPHPHADRPRQRRSGGHLMTDEAGLPPIKPHFAGHGTTSPRHGEYVPRRTIHTNTVEGFFSIFKRGMKGIYQHCGEKHLHRYLAEFDFRYSTASPSAWTIGARRALRGVVGKRLTYRSANYAATA